MDSSNSSTKHGVKIKKEPVDEDEGSSSDHNLSHLKNGWFEFRCDSGEVLFYFNIFSNEHRWIGNRCTCFKESGEETNSKSIGIQCDIASKPNRILSKDVTTEIDFSILGVQESRNAVSVQTEVSFLPDSKSLSDTVAVTFSEGKSSLPSELISSERYSIIQENKDHFEPLSKDDHDPNPSLSSSLTKEEHGDHNKEEIDEDSEEMIDPTLNLDSSPMKDEHEHKEHFEPRNKDVRDPIPTLSSSLSKEEHGEEISEDSEEMIDPTLNLDNCPKKDEYENRDHSEPLSKDVQDPTATLKCSLTKEEHGDHNKEEIDEDSEGPKDLTLTLDSSAMKDEHENKEHFEPRNKDVQDPNPTFSSSLSKEEHGEEFSEDSEEMIDPTLNLDNCPKKDEHRNKDNSEPLSKDVQDPTATLKCSLTKEEHGDHNKEEIDEDSEEPKDLTLTLDSSPMKDGHENKEHFEPRNKDVQDPTPSLSSSLSKEEHGENISEDSEEMIDPSLNLDNSPKKDEYENKDHSEPLSKDVQDPTTTLKCSLAKEEHGDHNKKEIDEDSEEPEGPTLTIDSSPMKDEHENKHFELLRKDVLDPTSTPNISLAKEEDGDHNGKEISEDSEEMIDHTITLGSSPKKDEHENKELFEAPGKDVEDPTATLNNSHTKEEHCDHNKEEIEEDSEEPEDPSLTMDSSPMKDGHENKEHFEALRKDVLDPTSTPNISLAKEEDGDHNEEEISEDFEEMINHTLTLDNSPKKDEHENKELFEAPGKDVQDPTDTLISSLAKKEHGDYNKEDSAEEIKYPTLTLNIGIKKDEYENKEQFEPISKDVQDPTATLKEHDQLIKEENRNVLPQLGESGNLQDSQSDDEISQEHFASPDNSDGKTSEEDLSDSSYYTPNEHNDSTSDIIIDENTGLNDVVSEEQNSTDQNKTSLTVNSVNADVIEKTSEENDLLEVEKRCEEKGVDNLAEIFKKINEEESSDVFSHLENHHKPSTKDELCEQGTGNDLRQSIETSREYVNTASLSSVERDLPSNSCQKLDNTTKSSEKPKEVQGQKSEQNATPITCKKIRRQTARKCADSLRKCLILQKKASKTSNTETSDKRRRYPCKRTLKKRTSTDPFPKRLKVLVTPIEQDLPRIDGKLRSTCNAGTDSDTAVLENVIHDVKHDHSYISTEHEGHCQNKHEVSESETEVLSNRGTDKDTSSDVVPKSEDIGLDHQNGAESKQSVTTDGIARNSCLYVTEHDPVTINIANCSSEVVVSSEPHSEVSLQRTKEVKDISECVESTDTDVSQRESDLKADDDQSTQSSPKKPKTRKRKRKPFTRKYHYTRKSLYTNVFACDQQNVDSTEDVDSPLNPSVDGDREDNQVVEKPKEDEIKGQADKRDPDANPSKKGNRSEAQSSVDGDREENQVLERTNEDEFQDDADERGAHDNRMGKGSSSKDQPLVDDKVSEENQVVEKCKEGEFHVEAHECQRHNNSIYKEDCLGSQPLMDGDAEVSKKNPVLEKSDEDEFQEKDEYEPKDIHQNPDNDGQKDLPIIDRKEFHGKEKKVLDENDDSKSKAKEKRQNVEEHLEEINLTMFDENQNECKDRSTDRNEETQDKSRETNQHLEDHPEDLPMKERSEEILIGNESKRRNFENDPRHKPKEKTEKLKDNHEQLPMSDKKYQVCNTIETQKENEVKNVDRTENMTDGRKDRNEYEHQDQGNRAVGSIVGEERNGMPSEMETENIKGHTVGSDETKAKYESQNQEKSAEEKLPVVETSDQISYETQPVSQGCQSDDLNTGKSPLLIKKDSKVTAPPSKDAERYPKGPRRYGRVDLGCKVCGRRFKSSLKLSHHMRGHKMAKPRTCSFCLRTFRSHSLLCDHLKYHNMASKYSCSYCKEGFISYQKLVSHFIKCSETKSIPQNSSSGSDAARNEVSLPASPLKNDPQLDNVTPSELTCNLCNVVYIYPKRFKKHLDLHSGMTNGTAAKNALKESYKALDDYIGNGKRNTKRVSEEVAVAVPTDSNHEVAKSQITSGDSKQDNYEGAKGPLSCTVCGRHFKKEFWLNLHIEKKHGVSAMVDLSVMEDATSPTKGNDEASENQNITSNGNRDENDESARNCPICGMLFKKEYWLNCHIDNKHGMSAMEDSSVMQEETSALDTNDENDENPLNCSVCGMHFKSKYRLNRHIDNKHSMSAMEDSSVMQEETSALDANDENDKNPLDCSVCGTHFKSKYRLNRHIDKKHGVSAKKESSVMQEETSALDTNDENDENPLNCSVCGTHFKSKYRLNRHIDKKHGVSAKKESSVMQEETSALDTNDENDENPLDCSVCGTHFKSKYRLNQHIDKKHEVSAKKESSVMQEETSALDTNDENDENPLDCSVCGTHFKSKYRLNRHIDKKHGVSAKKESSVMEEETSAIDNNDENEESPLDCSVCGMHFKLRYWLDRHIDKKHGVSAKKESSVMEEETSAIDNNDENEESPLDCSICGMHFKLRYWLNCHIKKKHGISAVEGPTQTRSPEPKKGESKQLENHTPPKAMVTEAENTTTTKDGEVGENIDNLVSSECPLKCKKCGILFKREFWYNYHMKNKHRMSIEQIARFSSPQAPEPKNDKRNEKWKANKCKKESQKNHAPPQERTEHVMTENGTKEKKMHKCEVCNREFVYLGYLENHSKLHALENRKNTKETGTSLRKDVPERPASEVKKNTGKTRNSFLETEACRNEDNVVIGYKRKNFICCQCPEEFPHLDDLLKHSSDKHAPPKCPHCEVSCSCTEELQSHLQVHRKEAAADRVKKICCKICGKEVSTALELIIHFRTHKRGRKRKVNEIQGEEEKGSPSLKEQSRSNSLEPTGSSFSDVPKTGKEGSSLQDPEEALSESAVPNASESTNQIISDSTKQSDLRLSVFFCYLCNKAFNNITKRLLHMKHSHPDGNRYACSICGRGFQRAHFYNQHKLKHHNIKSTELQADNIESSKISKNTSEINEGEQNRDGCISKDRVFSKGNTPAIDADLESDVSTARRVSVNTDVRMQIPRRRHYKCSICGKTFYKIKNLSQHKREHEDMQSTETTCVSMNTSTCIPTDSLSSKDINTSSTKDNLCLVASDDSTAISENDQSRNSTGGPKKITRQEKVPEIEICKDKNDVTQLESVCNSESSSRVRLSNESQNDTCDTINGEKNDNGAESADVCNSEISSRANLTNECQNDTIEMINEEKNDVGADSRTVYSSEVSSRTSLSSESQNETHSPTRNIFQYLNLETHSCSTLAGKKYKCSYCTLSFTSFYQRNSHVSTTHKMELKQFQPLKEHDVLTETNQGAKPQVSRDVSSQTALNDFELSKSFGAKEFFNASAEGNDDSIRKRKHQPNILRRTKIGRNALYKDDDLNAEDKDVLLETTTKNDSSFSGKRS